MSSRTASLPLAVRWTAPVAVVAVIAGGSLAVRASASAESALPPRTAAELLVSLQNAGTAPFAGTVSSTARLGLPSLPGSSSTSLQSLVSGTHDARVWYAAPDKTRVALVADLAETDVIHNGRDLWIWTSGKNTAQHALLNSRNKADKAGSAGTKDATRDPDASEAPETALTPQAAADKALAAIDPTTAVTVDGTARVAGRPVYELVLRPKDTRSLIGEVRIGIDSATSTPMRVQVYAAGAGTAALETSFTAINFSTPSPDMFTFTPPPGAKVSELGGSTNSTKSTGSTKAGPDATPAHASPTVIGTGWTSVLVVRGDVMSALDGSAPAPAAKGVRGSTDETLSTLMKATKPVSGSWGSGRLLRTKLFSVLMLDDGRTLVGAVTPEALETAAADPRAALVPPTK